MRLLARLAGACTVSEEGSMKRSTSVIIIGVGGLTIAGLMALASGDRLSGGADVIAGDLNQPTPTVEGGVPLQPSDLPRTDTNAPGIEAIPVSNPLNGDVPAFTEDAVRAYLDANPPVGWDTTTPQPEIINIRFISTEEAEAIVDHSIPRKPGDLLCIATVRGTFVSELPPSMAAAAKTDGDAPQSTLVMIFDAKTGNLFGEVFLREPQ